MNAKKFPIHHANQFRCSGRLNEAGIVSQWMQDNILEHIILMIKSNKPLLSVFLTTGNRNMLYDILQILLKTCIIWYIELIKH